MSDAAKPMTAALALALVLSACSAPTCPIQPVIAVYRAAEARCEQVGKAMGKQYHLLELDVYYGDLADESNFWCGESIIEVNLKVSTL